MPTVGFQWPRGNDSDSALRCPGTQAELDEGRRENWDWVIWAERSSPGSGPHHSVQRGLMTSILIWVQEHVMSVRALQQEFLGSGCAHQVGVSVCRCRGSCGQLSGLEQDRD